MDANLPRPTPDHAWQFLRDARDEDIPLVWAALTIARDEYPELDVDAYEAKIHAFGDRARADAGDDPILAVRAINNVLYDELGFTGNQGDYYDPRNSYLNDVVDRKLGIPISLALLQLGMAQRIGLPLRGVSFPGHFLVSLPVDGGLLVLDPYHRGRSIDAQELKARAKPHLGESDVQDEHLSQLLAPASNRAILARMLRNLKSLYGSRGDDARALRCTDRLLLVEPNQPSEWRDRGLLYLKVGHPKAAAADLQRYLAQVPPPEDAEQVRELLIQASVSAPRLN